MEFDNKDQPFQEKLSEFSEIPHPKVWRRIEESLNQKNSKKPFPLWWSFAGVAAVLLIGGFVFSPSTTYKRPVDSIEAAPTPVSSSENKTPGTPNLSQSNSKENYPIPNITNPKDNRNLVANPLNQVPTRIAVNPYTDTAQPTGLSPKNNTLLEKANTQTTAKDGSKPLGGLPEEVVTKATPTNTWDITEQEAQNQKLQSPVKDSKWMIGPALAPVYYRWTGNGSPISPAFANNSKAGLLNFSYGIAVSYAVTKNLNLRSGINRLDLGYQTNDVAFTSAFVSRSSSLIRTINYTENSKNVILQSIAVSTQVMQTNKASDLFAASPEQRGEMIQQFGYLEIPIELQYALINKSWGLNIIGGVSSLFLVNNSLSLDSNGDVMEIGTASNMNPLNFSTNIGLGAYYMLNRDVQFSIQPMFKWHLNTFSETSGQFSPYTLGLYSGLSLKF